MFFKIFSSFVLARLLPIILLLSSPTHLLANESEYERVNYSTASNEQQAEDIRVKVLGGFVTVSRLYRQLKLTPAQADDTDSYVGVSGALGEFAGSNNERESVFVSGRGSGSASGAIAGPVKRDYGVWIFNPDWYDLVFLDRDLNRISGADAASGANPVFNIDRNDFIYKRKNQGAYFEYQHNGADQRITPTDSGYRWTNREGDYIDYDRTGRATGYGDKNSVSVTFERDAKGLIQNVRDHFDRIVLTWTYDGYRPVRVEDYTGRRVTYQWNGNTLVGVTTVRGHQWRYEYDSIAGNRVLTALIDPEDQRFEYRYRMSKSGFVTTRGGGATSGRPIIGDDGVVVGSPSTGGGLVGGRSVSIAVPSMLILTEKVYPDGKRKRFQYFYDHDTQTYVLVSTNSDGLEHEQWFALDGEIKQELKGGRLAHKRVRDGRRVLETDPYGNKTLTTYTRWEAVESIRFADDSEIRYQYLPNLNFPTLITDELGVKTKMEYDAKGNLVRSILGFEGDDPRISEFAYDQYGQLIRERMLGDADTSTTEVEHSYDTYGNRVSTQDARGNTITLEDFDAMGQPRKTIDRRGATINSVYDLAGNLLSITTAMEHTSNYAYDKLNRLVEFVDAEGRTMRFQHDSRDNVILQTNNQGETVQKSVRMDGQPLRIVDESGQTVIYRYDRAARLISKTDSTGNVITYRYERGDELAGDRLQNIVGPNNQLFYVYDKLNRKVQQRISSLDGALSNTTDYVYNRRGELIEEIDSNGNRQQRRYNEHGEVIAEINALGEVVTTQYDKRGNILEVTDSLGSKTRYRYDDNDNNTVETRPQGQAFAFEFDEGDRPITLTDPNGNRAQIEYDLDGRPIRESNFQAGSVTPERVIEYSYDKVNALKGYSDGSTSALYTYDSLGRLEAEEVDFGGFTKTIATTYRKNSQIKSKTDAEGLLHAYAYDSSGKFTQLAMQGGGSIGVTEYQGFLASKFTLPGGTEKEITYDGLARVSSIRVADANSATLMDHRYNRDLVGNVLTKQTLLGEFRYQYDKVYRLINVHQPNAFGARTYSYNSNGNRTQSNVSGETIGYEYNVNQELTRLNQTSGATQYSYDDNGSLIEESTDNSLTQYSYNSFSRLASVDREISGQLVNVATYTYDPFNRRVSKTIGDQTTYFLYDGPNLVGEYDKNGALVVGFIYPPVSTTGTTPLASKRPAPGGGDVFYYHLNDHLETPQKIIDVDGVIRWQGEHDAFGQTIEVINSVSNNLRFPGQYYDRESGLNYNWNRYYKLELGRYNRPDPIGLAGGYNSFAYADSNPIGKTDPEGLVVPALIIRGGLIIAGRAAQLYMRMPCVIYALVDCKGKTVYIGISKNPALRWYGHNSRRGVIGKYGCQNICPVTMIPIGGARARLSCRGKERSLIRRQRPIWNTQHTGRGRSNSPANQQNRNDWKRRNCQCSSGAAGAGV